MAILNKKFFQRSAVAVAKDLLGKYLVRRIGRKIVRVMITETEAYEGFEDKASHAHRGQTKRNFVMFGPAGRWYVYFVYGNHWMLNIVTGKKGYPSAVLLRGVAGASGPGRLTKFFKIEKRFNNLPANRTTGLWISSAPLPRGVVVRSSPRIGVNYAGPVWSKKKWRFYIENSPKSGFNLRYNGAKYLSLHKRNFREV